MEGEGFERYEKGSKAWRVKGEEEGRAARDTSTSVSEESLFINAVPRFPGE